MEHLCWSLVVGFLWRRHENFLLIVASTGWQMFAPIGKGKSASRDKAEPSLSLISSSMAIWFNKIFCNDCIPSAYFSLYTVASIKLSIWTNLHGSGPSERVAPQRSLRFWQLPAPSAWVVPTLKSWRVNSMLPSHTRQPRQPLPDGSLPEPRQRDLPTAWPSRLRGLGGQGPRLWTGHWHCVDHLTHSSSKEEE